MSTLFTGIPVLQALAHEDILLALLLLVEPILQRLLAAAFGGAQFTDLSPDMPNAPLIGIVLLGSIAGAAISIASRSPNEDRTLDMEAPSGYAHFPLMAALPMILSEALSLFHADAGPLFGLAALLPVVTLLLHRWLPVLPALLRRLAMTPFVLICAWVFTGLLDPFVQGLLQLGSGGGASPLQALGAVSGLIGLAAMVFYMMFILAPRQIAGDEADWGTWGMRMIVFVASLFANLALPRLLGA